MTSWNSRGRLSVAGRLLLVGGIAMILLLGFNAAKLSVNGPTRVYAAASDTRDHPFTVNTDLTQKSGYTGGQLTNWLNRAHPGSRLAAYGSSFADAEAKTGVTAQGLLALAIVQTGWGAQISGNDVYAISGHSYSSIGTGIVSGAVWIKQNYLTPGGTYYAGSTLAGMGKHYATSASWPGLVASVAQKMYSPQTGATLTPVTPHTSPPITPAPAPPPAPAPAPPAPAPAPVTPTPTPVHPTPAPTPVHPTPTPTSPAANPPAAAKPPAPAQPNPGPNGGDSGNGSTPPDNGGTPPDNTGTPPDNSGTPPDNGGSSWNPSAGGDPGTGTDPVSTAPSPPVAVPTPEPQQTCVPLLQPALAPGLQPCIPVAHADSHGSGGAGSPKGNGKSHSGSGNGQNAAQPSSTPAPSGSGSGGGTSSGSGSGGNSAAGGVNTSTGSGSGGRTGSGSGNGTSSASTATGGSSTGSGGAVGTAAGGVTPASAPQSSPSSPQAAAVKEVSLVASSGDGLAWPAVLGGLALFLGLALLLLARRGPSRARPLRR